MTPDFRELAEQRLRKLDEERAALVRLLTVISTESASTTRPSPTRDRVLEVFRTNPTARTSDIARDFGVSRQAINQAITSAMRRGLLCRTGRGRYEVVAEANNGE